MEKMKFIAMNRFKIALNRENDFENIWKNRETHLNNKLSTPSASTCSSGNTYHEKQIVSITDKFLGRGDKDCQAAFTVLAAFLVGI